MRFWIFQVLLPLVIITLAFIWYSDQDRYCKETYGSSYQFIYSKFGISGCIEIKR